MVDDGKGVIARGKANGWQEWDVYQRERGRERAEGELGGRGFRSSRNFVLEEEVGNIFIKANKESTLTG